jgi:hypothetical protein
MKRFALIAGALAISSVAAASDTEFKHDGEFRVRYYNDMTPSGVKGKPLNRADSEGRFKVGMTARKGEKLQARLGLLHGTIFGNDKRASTSVAGTGYNTNSTDNILLVNEAYGWWKASDALALKVGRFHVNIADGAVFSSDDWLVVPHTHEGLQASYEMDAMNLNFYAIKYLDNNTNAGNPDSDPEVNNYILSLDFKNLPEALKTANLHVLNVKRQETAAYGLSDAMHVGLTVGGDVSNVMYNFTMAMQSGSISKTAAADNKLAGNMFDLMVGYSMPETMGLKVWANYHMDSGDDNAGDDKNETYQSLYYDSHKYAGLMDIIGWGNLTQMSVGADVMPSEDMTAGVALHMFSKTKENAAATTTTRPNGQAITGALANKKDLGMELDVYASKKYDSNFSIDAHLGAFMPGAAFKDAATKKEATIMQAMVMGKMSF